MANIGKATKLSVATLAIIRRCMHLRRSTCRLLPLSSLEAQCAWQVACASDAEGDRLFRGLSAISVPKWQKLRFGTQIEDAMIEFLILNF